MHTICRSYDKLYRESLINYFMTQEDGEEVGKGLQMGKRLLRALGLVFGCIAVASLVYHLVLIFGASRIMSIGHVSLVMDYYVT